MVFQLICSKEFLLSLMILFHRTVWILSTSRYSLSILKFWHKYLFHVEYQGDSFWVCLMEYNENQIFSCLHVSMANDTGGLVLINFPWYARILWQSTLPNPSPSQFNMFLLWNLKYVFHIVYCKFKFSWLVLMFSLEWNMLGDGSLSVSGCVRISNMLVSREYLICIY